MICQVLYVGLDGSSIVGHKGFELKDPTGYADGLWRERGIRAVLVDTDTAERFGWKDFRCPFCDERHAPPYDWSCIL